MAKTSVTDEHGRVPNTVLNNKDISLKAKGLFAYIQSKPKDWNFSAENICTQCKEKIDAIRVTLKELEDFKLLRRRKFQNEKGHWDIEYKLVFEHSDLHWKNPTLENPTQENPTSGFPTLEVPTLENPYTGKTPHLSKEELSNNNSSTKVLPDEHGSPVVLEVIAEEVIEVPAAEEKPVRKQRPSRRKNPEDYSIVTKMKLIVYESNKLYRWNGLDGSAAKEIARSITEVGRTNKNGVEPTEEEILKYFRVMLNPKYHPAYFKGNLDLKKINSEFNAITNNMQKPGGANGVGKTQKAIDNSAKARQMILDQLEKNGQ